MSMRTDEEAKRLYWAIGASVAAWVAAIVLALAFSAKAHASPVDYVFSVDEPIPQLNFGFARIEIPMPLGATLADVEVVKVLSSSLVSRSAVTARITYIANPDAPMVWRRIEFLLPPHPMTQPTDAVIGVSAGLLILDGGQHAQPLP